MTKTAESGSAARRRVPLCARTAPRRVMGVAFLCVLAGCGGDDARGDLRVVERLGLLVPVVESEGRAPRVEGDGALIQGPGELTWYFPIPRGASLRGSASARTSAAGRVHVELLRRGEKSVRLLERSLAQLEEGEGFALDLSPAAGEMAGLRFTLEPDSEPGSVRDPTLVWRDLAIVAPRREEPARVGLPRGDYNVLLVLFDTLRADRTEPYGASDVRTPEMRELASHGTTFANARSNASWTAPSLASILTGTYPSRHGVSGSGLFGALSEISTLAESLPYLPELLQKRGYTTVAVLNNVVVSPRFGFGRGFDAAHPYFRSREEIVAQGLSPEQQADHVWSTYFEPALAEREGAPFFFFLHELDPHHPYQAPPPFDSMYGEFPDVEPGLFDSIGAHMRYKHDPSAFSARDMEALHAWYAAEVSYMDGYLGRLLERLERAKLRDDTLVVFLSDHGESLGQHGRLGHGDTLYDEVLRVPFILSLPGVLPEGRRVDDPVELVDLVPTLLDLLAVDVPPEVQGRSLLPELGGEAGRLPERPGFAQAHFGARFGLDSVRFRGWKLIQGRDDDGQAHMHLYDLREDPGERVDRWEDAPVVGGTLRQMLELRVLGDAKARAGSETVDLDTLDPETRSNLEALGYVE